MRILKLSADYWNIRGSLKLGGMLDIDTQASLLRLASGRFVLLDSLALDAPTLAAVRAATGNGADIEAILNLHPFHTVHVQAAHQAFPQAKLYGTRRHVERFADLPWEAELTESAELHARYADDLAFSVPAGVDFVSANPNLHFASVLAYHRASGALHVDDTLMVMRLPGPLKALGTRVAFHPTLAPTLQRRAGAAQDFRDWAQGLIRDWGQARHLCAAHTHMLADAGPLGPRIEQALGRVRKTLARHEAKHG